MFDGLEVVYQTNPLARDTDGDTIDDFREIFADFTNPNDPVDRLNSTYIGSYRNIYVQDVTWRLDSNGYFSNVDNSNIFGMGVKLKIDDSQFYPYDRNVGTSSDGNELRMRPSYLLNNKLVVSRRYLMPVYESDYIRIMDVIHNVSNESISITVTSEDEYTINERDIRVYTSSGDSTLNSEDRYRIVWNGFDDSQLHYIHVFGDNSDKLKPDSSSELFNGYRYSRLRYKLSIPPGEYRMLAHYVATAENLENAIDKAEEISVLPVGASAELTVQNALNTLNFNFDLTPSVIFVDTESLYEPALENSRIFIEARASLGESITIVVNGEEYQTVDGIYANIPIDVPAISLAGDTLRIKAIVKGYGGQTAETDTRSIPIMPSATVTGVVMVNQEGDWVPISDTGYYSLFIYPSGIEAAIDENGHFTFSGVPPTGGMEIVLEGFVDDSYYTQSFQGIVVESAGEHDIGELRLNPESPTIIRARILNSDFEPAASYTVIINVRHQEYEYWQEFSKTTDEEGRFSLEVIDIPEGAEVGFSIHEVTDESEGVDDYRTFRGRFGPYPIEHIRGINDYGDIQALSANDLLAFLNRHDNKEMTAILSPKRNLM